MSLDPLDEMLRMRDRILSESGFQDIESPAECIPRRPLPAGRESYFLQAQEFLWEHGWNSGDCYERRVWELHAVEALSNREIARRLGSYRKKVDRTIKHYRAMMLGQLAPRRGRRELPDGFGKAARWVNVRWNGHYLLALDRVREWLRARGLRGTLAEAIRLSVLAQARDIEKR